MVQHDLTRFRVALSRQSHGALQVVFLQVCHVIMGVQTETPGVLEIGLSSVLLGTFGGANLVGDDRNG